MATVKKCDRCGATYERNKNKNDHIAFEKPDHEKGFDFVIADLCPKCNNEFLDWINTFDQGCVGKIVSTNGTDNSAEKDFSASTPYPPSVFDSIKSITSQFDPSFK